MRLPIWSWQLCFKYVKFHFYNLIITTKKISDPLTLFPVFPSSICRGGMCIIIVIQFSQQDVGCAGLNNTVSWNLYLFLQFLHVLNLHYIWQSKEWTMLKDYILYSYCIQISADLKDSMYMCREKSMSFLKLLEVPHQCHIRVLFVSFC